MNFQTFVGYIVSAYKQTYKMFSTTEYIKTTNKLGYVNTMQGCCLLVDLYSTDQIIGVKIHPCQTLSHRCLQTNVLPTGVGPGRTPASLPGFLQPSQGLVCVSLLLAEHSHVMEEFGLLGDRFTFKLEQS